MMVDYDYLIGYENDINHLNCGRYFIYCSHDISQKKNQPCHRFVISIIIIDLIPSHLIIIDLISSIYLIGILEETAHCIVDIPIIIFTPVLQLFGFIAFLVPWVIYGKRWWDEMIISTISLSVSSHLPSHRGLHCLFIRYWNCWGEMRW